MARPKKAPDEKRTEQLAPLRVTASERAFIEAQAAVAGLSPSDFVRRRALGRKVEAAAHTQADAALLLELNRIGVNLNQIARAMNSERREFGDLGDVLAMLKAALGKVAGDGS